MDTKTKYYVIEFEKLPRENYDKYACVPVSWVLGHNSFIIAFRYPIADMRVTRKHVQDGDDASKDWPIHLGSVKYETDNLANAKELQYFIKQTQAYEKSNETPTKPKVIIKEIRANQNLGNETFYPDGERMEEEHGFEKSTEHDKSMDKHRVHENADRPGSTGARKDNQASRNPSSSNSILNDSHAIHLIRTTLDHLVKEVKRQNESIEKLRQDFIINRDATVHNAILPKIEENTNTDSATTTCLETNDNVKETNTPAAGPSGILKRRKSVRIQEDQERKEEQEENEGTPKKKVDDPKNSKWTLRYHALCPGLEELMKDSGVYIDSSKFYKCKSQAKDGMSLARLLLVEIFTEQALGTCSLTGARVRAFDPDGTKTKPGLDESALNALINFVEDYCRQEGWAKTRRMEIMNTLRNKIRRLSSAGVYRDE